MNIKKIIAKNSSQALARISAELGPDAAIISSQRVAAGIEYTVSVSDDSGVEPGSALNGKTGFSAAAPAAAAANRNRGQAGQNSGTAPQMVWSQDADILALQQELGSMRSMLEGQLKAQAWKDLRRENRSSNYALSLLHAIDFEPAIAERFARTIAPDDDRDLQRQILRMAIKSEIKTAAPPASGVVILVGPPGAGKTTAIAKLAAQYVQKGCRDDIALVTTDNARIAAQDQLRAYGRILQVPVHSAANMEEAITTLKVIERKDLVIVDTGGLSCHDEAGFMEIQQLCEALPSAQLMLTLPAEKAQSTLRDIVSGWSRLPLNGIVLTRLDEVVAIGCVLSILQKYALPLTWCSTGPNVPQDLEVADAGKIARRAIKRAEELVGPEVDAVPLSRPPMNTGKLISTVV